MKKRALWIFDENYIMLTYLSVCSFVEHCDVVVTLIYCNGEMAARDRKAFTDLNAEVEIYHFDADVSQYDECMQANILNRFARLHYTRLFENDLLFMVDSDVAFGPSLKEDYLEVLAYYKANEDKSPMISGVVEFLSASDAYLYFKRKDEHGFTRKTPEKDQIYAYESIYGDGWQSLIRGFQFNNGFLIFYKARPLIDQWETYYLDGLKNKEINPLDDQVPLAAAIQKTGCAHWQMESKWNSLGDLNGPFNMFHAWGGEWKIEIDQVLVHNTPSSDYGKICQKYLDNSPDHWISMFKDDLKSIPYRYRNIKGAFDHGTVFSDLVREMEAGHVVEVGTYQGRSACFVAELIKAADKNIVFETIDHFERPETSKEYVISNLEKAEVGSFVNVIESHSLEASKLYDSNQLDFVFLDTDSGAEELTKELEAWYDKVKEGGVLAGYDYTIHDTVFKSYDCVSASFCDKHSVPLRTYEYQFLIQKPFKSH